MKHLWAPWRMPYIQKEKKTRGCMLCEKPQARRDRENLILYRSDKGFVMLNLYPYNNGHLLVSPYRHVAALEALEEQTLHHLLQLVKKSVIVLKKSSKPDGVNIGLNLGSAAGAGIEAHLHFHLVPRWNGDTNFMMVVSGVRVIPEGLTATYRRLKPHFE